MDSFKCKTVIDKRFNAERKQIIRRIRTKERFTIDCDSKKIKRKKRKKIRNEDKIYSQKQRKKKERK